MGEVIEQWFDASADRVPAVRSLAEDVRPALGEHDRFAAELLLTELFGNAVRHGGSPDPVRVRLERDGALLHMELHDAGTGFDFRPRPAGQRVSGWGLHLVATHAPCWGVDCSHGARVWLQLQLADELSLSAAPAPRAAPVPPRLTGRPAARAAG